MLLKTQSETRPAHVLHRADMASSDSCAVPEYYSLNAPPAPATRELADSCSTDILIVGAGFTGLSTALHLGMRGCRSMVVESRSIGWGASGRNFGQVVPYLKNGPSAVIAQMGAHAGERLIEGTGRGPDLVFGLIDQFAIECAARRAGLIFGLHSESGRPGLEARTRYWRDRGAPVEMLDAAATQRLIGSDYYSASALDRRGGTINPLAYVRGLARAALDTGAEIHTDTPVSSIQRIREGWSADTPRGTIKAKHVVLATNGYTPRGLWPGLRDSIIPMRAYQAVSEPLPPQMAQQILSGGHALTDTRHLFSGVLVHSDGRIQAGLDGPAFTRDGQAMLHTASRRLRLLFPEMQDLRWDHHWSGWIAMTFDQLPHLHELGPGLWAGLGYSGRGIAHATMMGREIAWAIAPRSGDERTFPVTTLKPRVASRFARPLVGSLLNYYRVIDRLNEPKRSG